jgi:hypothetical protein
VLALQAGLDILAEVNSYVRPGQERIPDTQTAISWQRDHTNFPASGLSLVRAGLPNAYRGEDPGLAGDPRAAPYPNRCIHRLRYDPLPFSPRSMPWCGSGLSRRLENRTHVLYVSPLKALYNDIQKNLQVPLNGIRTGSVAVGCAHQRPDKYQ